jgi:hypothetical protein
MSFLRMDMLDDDHKPRASRGKGHKSQAMDDDCELLLLLREEVLRDGGCVRVNALKGYSPRIGRLLGDQRLMQFLDSHEGFCVSEDGKTVQLTDIAPVLALAAPRQSKSTPIKRNACLPVEPLNEYSCQNCSARFSSRNRLFKHLKQTAKNDGICINNNTNRLNEVLANPSDFGKISCGTLLGKLRQLCEFELQRRQLKMHRRSSKKASEAAGNVRVVPASLKWLCDSPVSNIISVI